MREIILGFLGPQIFSKGTNYPKNMKDKKKIMLDMKRYGLLHFVTTIEKIGPKLVFFVVSILVKFIFAIGQTCVL